MQTSRVLPQLIMKIIAGIVHRVNFSSVSVYKPFSCYILYEIKVATTLKPGKVNKSDYIVTTAPVKGMEGNRKNGQHKEQFDKSCGVSTYKMRSR